MKVTDDDLAVTFASNISVTIVVAAVLIVPVVLFCCLKCRKNVNETTELAHIKHVQKFEILSPIQRLEKLYKDEVLSTVQIYFELKIIGNSTWLQFLDERLHELFHDFKQRTRCCRNNLPLKCSNQIHGKLTNEQFNLLYQKDPTIPVVHEVKKKKGVRIYCICPFSPKTDTKVSHLDITLICLLMKTCRQTPAGNPKWFDDIKTVRNEFYHRGDDCTIPDDQVEEWRKTLEDRVIKIASTVSDAFKAGVRRRIAELDNKYSQIDLNICVNLANIQQSLQNKYFQAGDVSFHIKDKPRTKFSTAASGSDKECIVEWTFKTPGDWDVAKMQEKLQSIERLGDYIIEFVYKGSLIVHTQADISIFCKEEFLIESMEEFLFLFVKLLKIQAQPDKSLVVALSIAIPRTEDAKQDVPISQSKLKVPTRLKFIKLIDFFGEYTDCIVVGETYAVVDCNNNQILFFDKYGKHIRYFKTSSEPRALTATKTKIVVCMRSEDLEIYDFKTRKPIERLHVQYMLEGLSCAGGRIHVGVRDKGIQVMDLRGHVIEHLPTEIDAYYMTIENNRIYYSDGDRLICCSMNGKEIWTVEPAIIRHISGITVDDSGYIYLTGHDSQNVVAISPDGKQVNQLLSASDGLERPSGICYNKATKTLLVCNHNGPLVFYSIVK